MFGGQLALGVAIYVGVGVLMLWLGWRRARPGIRRLVVVSALAALLFAPTVWGPVSPVIVPWWWVLPCAVRSCGMDPIAVFLFAVGSLLGVGAVFFVIGLIGSRLCRPL